jgi:hypothetical protein
MEHCGVIDWNCWEAEAKLFRSGMQDEKAIQLFQGQLLDAVYLALAQPEKERPSLFISCEIVGRELTWTDIIKISEQPDFPVII